MAKCEREHISLFFKLSADFIACRKARFERAYIPRNHKFDFVAISIISALGPVLGGIVETIHITDTHDEFQTVRLAVTLMASVPQGKSSKICVLAQLAGMPDTQLDLASAAFTPETTANGSAF